MLKSLLFAASLFAVASVATAEPVLTTDEVLVSDDSLFDIDLNAEVPCDRDPKSLDCSIDKQERPPVK